ncbi:ABC transporter ATP-binding protein [Mycolicibacterium sp.]|uniref:ABC transporter ATP-binding protein n=1 Tax=Mycolicibacterium sp. TaxID=2320850 RepID=UPI003D134888
MLEVENLHVEYVQNGVSVPALRGVSLRVEAGRSVAIVGESGSGKSTLALAVLGSIKPPVGRITGGEITVGDVELVSAQPRTLRSVLHHQIGFIPQDPSTALDPLFTVRSQIAEVLRGRATSEIDSTAVELLTSLGVANAEHRLRSYPHEFSGGMKQRVAMAIALAKNPGLLIADEPTTALDVTTQLGILRTLDRLRVEQNLSTLFITHDLRVARLLCQEVIVMYAGEVVESGPIDQVMHGPRHPYTRALLDALGTDVQPRTRLKTIAGQPPALSALPPGCSFAPRCPIAEARCDELPPVVGGGERMVACWKAAG